MQPFTYLRPGDAASASAIAATTPGAQFLAGGTSQFDLIKEGVERPAALVDTSRLPLATVKMIDGGGVRIGANATNTAVADHPLLTRYVAVREALHAGASQQRGRGAGVHERQSVSLRRLSAHRRRDPRGQDDDGGMSDPSITDRNRTDVCDAFDRWAEGRGNVFDLLADDARWTIAGSGPFARTWHGRQAYIDAAVTPLFDRLAAAAFPDLLGL